MELTLAHQTETGISVTCDSQHSHTFDLGTLISSKEKEPSQPVAEPRVAGRTAGRQYRYFDQIRFEFPVFEIAHQIDYQALVVVAVRINKYEPRSLGCAEGCLDRSAITHITSMFDSPDVLMKR